MTRVQRSTACVGRFAARGPVRDRCVLLIDDVVTSGCQAREAIRALMAAGAADCRFVAIAKATAAPEDARVCERLALGLEATGGRGWNQALPAFGDRCSSVGMVDEAAREACALGRREKSRAGRVAGQRQCA
jgi:hypothetical protein